MATYTQNKIALPSGDIINLQDTVSGYIKGGTVSQPEFTGTAGSVSVSGTPSGSVSISTGTVSAQSPSNYTPAGSVSVTPTVELNTTSVNSITDVGTLPSCTLPTLTFSPGTDADDNLVIS